MTEKSKIKILCIEDEVAVADYISSLLDKNFYSVSSIGDGKEALRFLLTTTDPPDIILLDYILPSMDGLKILKELKAKKKNYAVIFLTADETLETAVTAMKEGALDYLTKTNYLKTELNIKIEKNYQIFKDRLRSEYYEEQLSLLSLAVEQSPNSMIITNLKGEIEYVNRQFTRQTGYKSEEVIGKTPRIFKTDSYPPAFFSELWKTITSGKTWKGEFVNKKKNGELFYEKATISPIHNKEGEIVSFLGIKEDITELKKIEEALTRKNAEMNHFFTVVVDLLCIIDSTSKKFIRVNKAWEDVLGYSIDELIGKPYTDFIHPDDVELSLHASETLKKTGRILNFVNRYRCKNGKYKFIEWSSITNYDGVSYSSARDITDRKLNELALKESETRFRSIFEMANSGIFFSDKNSQIILVNQAFQSMVEYSLKDLYLMDFSQFTHLDDLSVENDLLRQLINRKINQYRIEKRYESKSGRIIWVDLAVAVIRNENGDPNYYVGVVNDISERKHYEQQLKAINATKDKFFSIISHDLRNQFSGIQGLSGILLTNGNDLSEEAKEKYISILHTSSKSSLSLLENLLEWSRSQLDRLEFELKIHNLFKLVKDVMVSNENQAVLKEIEVFNNVNKETIIAADGNMISTVIRNLLNNAVKFTPKGGQVIISSWVDNNFHHISIKDNGIGMNSETIGKLFKIENTQSTFGTQQERGTGLGLILCQEFILKHGGEIKVKSEVGLGSEFIIVIPVEINH